MSVLAPTTLWLLAIPLAGALTYVLAQQQRRRHAVRFTNLELLDSVAPRRPARA